MASAIATGGSLSRIEAVDGRTLTSCMEQLQQAYVMSVASTAGCGVTNIERDTYGVDLEIVRSFPAPREEVSVKAQLKSTTQISPSPDRDYFSYQFTKREYMQRLTTARRWSKYILIVMSVNRFQTQWTDCSHDFLRLRHCCYWICLEGRDVPSADRPSIQIPTKNVFDARALVEILDKVDRGESLCES